MGGTWCESTVHSIIDAHVHCSNRRDDALIPYALRNALEYDLTELLSKMERHRVERGLLLSPPLLGGAPLPNREVLALCAKSKGRLYPVLTVEPDKRSVLEAVALARERRDQVKGFKVRLGYVAVYADDPLFDALYDFAAREGLPVLFHTGDTATGTGSLEHAHPLTLDRLANKRTELRIVICHMGNPWMIETSELLYKHPGVYADISGLVVGESRYFRQYMALLASRISEAIYFAGGADKILFGTDYPLQTHENSLALVNQLRIEAGDAEKILHDNARKLFSL